MKLTLEELRADLLVRWKAAFGRISEVTADLPGELETVFTRYPAYSLSDFSPKKFKPGARVFRAPDPDGDDYVFQRDSRGRPIHVRYSHRVNRVDWQGVYRYAADEVEHIEFCMKTRVPSLYNRLMLSGSTVIAEQRFVCDGGGSDRRFVGLTSAEQVRQILGDPHGHFVYLTRYHVEGGVTKSADEYHQAGGEVHRPTLEYRYSGNKLQRIVQHWPGGERRTVFAARTKTTIRELSEKLSEKIATVVLTRLREASFESPLVALELSYRDHDHHIPQLIPLTELDQVQSLALAAEIDPSRWIGLAEEDFAPELTEFDARVEAGGSASAVSKMLRKAARLVTDTDPAPECFGEGFVAFAIDWELEGGAIGKIVKQCGAKPATIRRWKKMGWI